MLIRAKILSVCATWTTNDDFGQFFDARMSLFGQHSVLAFLKLPNSFSECQILTFLPCNSFCRIIEHARVNLDEKRVELLFIDLYICTYQKSAPIFGIGVVSRGINLR